VRRNSFTQQYQLWSCLLSDLDREEQPEIVPWFNGLNESLSNGNSSYNLLWFLLDSVWISRIYIFIYTLWGLHLLVLNQPGSKWIWTWHQWRSSGPSTKRKRTLEKEPSSTPTNRLRHWIVGWPWVILLEISRYHVLQIIRWSILPRKIFMLATVGQ